MSTITTDSDSTAVHDEVSRLSPTFTEQIMEMSEVAEASEMLVMPLAPSPSLVQIDYSGSEQQGSTSSSSRVGEVEEKQTISVVLGGLLGGLMLLFHEDSELQNSLGNTNFSVNNFAANLKAF